MNLRKWVYKGEFQNQGMGSLSKEKAEWPRIHIWEDASSPSYGMSLLSQPREGREALEKAVLVSNFLIYLWSYYPY